MKHILPTLLFLCTATQALADDTLIYNQTVTVDTIFSHYDNVEIVAHNTITLDAGFTFSSNGNGSFTANADPWNVEEPPHSVPPGNSLDSTGTLDGGYIVGTINGQPGVSPTGAGTYSIPIEVPPGNKGMVPQLAITYNSQAGNGILGRGWSLGGISSIVATGKTRYYDNEYSSISDTDTACRVIWDGQRLLALNSAGLDADSFRTEMVSNVKITKESETGYVWFKVKTPDGRTLEFGRSTDSRMRLDTATEWKWMLNKVYDRNENTVEYTYTTNINTKRILLSKVEYGGPSTSFKNEISLSYTTRDDISYGYIHDNLIVNEKLLDNITIKSNSEDYVKYEFLYDTTNNETLLDEIIQYDKDDYRFNATTVDWETVSSSLTPTDTTTNIINEYGDNISYYSGDFTGDGVFDLVAVDLDVYYDIYKYYLYKGTTSGLPSSWDETGNLPRSYTNKYWDEHTSYIGSSNGCDYQSTSNPLRESFGQEDVYYIFSGDFDGDGVEELFVKVLEWEDFYDYLPGDLNTGFTSTFLLDFGGFHSTSVICNMVSNFTETGTTMQLTEGIGHFLNFDESSGSDNRLHSFRLGQGIKYDEQYSQFPDIDGRGYNSFPDNNSIVYYDPIEDTAIAFCSITADDDLRWAEFNGDGKADYIDPANTDLRVYTYNASTNSFGSALYNSGYLLGTIDFNGDGISAFVALGDVEYEVLTFEDLWDEWCGDNDENCSVTDSADWASYLTTYDLVNDYDTFNDDTQKCPFGDDQICRLGFVYSEDTIHRSIGRELFAKHLSGQGPEVSFGYFEGAHDHDDPLFTKAVAADIDADGNNELLLFSQTQLVNIYHNFTPSYSNGTISIDYETEEVNSSLSFRFQSGDFNGDGIFELIFPKDDKLLTYASGQPGKLVSTVRNGLGVESRYSYKPLTNSSVYTVESDASFPVIDFTAPWYVVSSVSSDNGVADSSYVEYDYEGAKIHIQGKGFLGFMKTTVENDLINASQISTSTYDTRFFHTYPVSSTQKAGTQNVQISTNHTRIDSLDTHKFKVETDSVIVQNVLANTTTTTSYTYNGDGLVSEKETNVDGVATLTEKYSYTNGGWHLNALPEYVTRISERDGEIETDSTVFTYNTNNGNLTKKKGFYGTDREFTTTFSNFDAYGNPRNTGAGGKRGLNLSVDSIETKMSYSSDGRFLLSKSGPLNHKATFDIDDATGLPESRTGPNRKETSYEYGPFLRMKKIVHPDRIEKATALYWADQTTPSKPQGALYYKWISNSSSPPIKTFYDEMGRELRTATMGFDDDSIYVDTEYDFEGRVKRRSNPYFSTGTANWSRTTYDNYGRTDSIISTDTTITTYSYSDLTTTITTKKGSISTTTKKTVNALGEIVESEDNNGNKVVNSYSPDGKLKETSVHSESTHSTVITYDAQGNRTSIDDPDAGTITSLYDSFGQLLRQVNANDDTTTYQYDMLGRMTQMSDGRGDMIYSYVTDTASAAFGMTDSVYLNDYSIQEIFEYDSDYGRLTSGSKSFLNKTLENTYTYDWFGRPSTHTYPSDFEIQYAYTSNGYLEQVTGNGLTLWSCSGVNALGQITSYSQGGNSTTITYNMHGELNRVHTGSIMDTYYSFDERGNLAHRLDDLSKQKEVFTYDNLNRLTDIDYYDNNVYQSAYDVNIAYDDCGNITSKTGVSSSINYGEGTGMGPHALTSLENPDKSYYPPPQSITYNHFNKVSSISDTLTGGVSLTLDFTYGLSNQRIKTVKTRNSTIERVKYFDVGYEEDTTSVGLKKYHYIHGGNGLTAIFVMEGTGNDTMYYVLSDHLGSLTTIVNATTSAVDKYSFNAWGRPRDASDWTKPDTSYLFAGRGYTGHEHLTDFNLINMNGRVFDPILGRFLSPDPYVQMPYYPNNYNRYTYALNNPLIYTDPSGYLSYLSNPGTLEYASQNSEVIDYGANRWRSESNMISQYGGGGMGDNWFDQQWHPTGGWRYDWNEWEYSNIFTGETRFHSEATPSFFGSIIGPSGVEKHYRKEWVCHVYNPYTYEDGSQAYVPWYSTYIWSLEFVDYNKIPTSFGIGQPGSWESLIPIWGSGRAAIDHFQNGDYWRGLGHTALAVSDVFLVKSIGTALGKGAWKLGGHSWSATRSWLGKRGYAQAGQPVHHWALTQSTARKYGLESISNQPWNLMPMQSQAMHTAVHGWGRNAYGPIGQFWYGTPTWFKASIFSGGGRLFD